jgi:hypothetical protein
MAMRKYHYQVHPFFIHSFFHHLICPVVIEWETASVIDDKFTIEDLNTEGSVEEL